MDVSFLLKGIIIGFAMAAVAVESGIRCIRRTLEFGRFSGLSSALGIATVSTIYAIQGCVVVLAFIIFADALMVGQFWLLLIGGGVLLFLGGRSLFTKVKDTVKERPHTTVVNDFLNDFIAIFLLTIINPMVILSSAPLCVALGLSSIQIYQGGYSEVVTLVVGVFLGSAAWWLFLSAGVIMFRKEVNDRLTLSMNRVAGLMLTALGIAALLTFATEAMLNNASFG